MKAKIEETKIALPMHIVGVRRGWVVNATPGHLTRGPHYAGGWVDLGVSLDEYRKSRLHQNLNLRQSNP
jgi:hypothetical protein